MNSKENSTAATAAEVAVYLTYLAYKSGGIAAVKNTKTALTYRVAFFSGPPPNLTKSQAHYKFLDLGNLGGGQFNLYRAWDLVKLGGGQKKKPPCS